MTNRPAASRPPGRCTRVAAVHSARTLGGEPVLSSDPRRPRLVLRPGGWWFTRRAPVAGRSRRGRTGHSSPVLERRPMPGTPRIIPSPSSARVTRTSPATKASIRCRTRPCRHTFAGAAERHLRGGPRTRPPRGTNSAAAIGQARMSDPARPRHPVAGRARRGRTARRPGAQSGTRRPLPRATGDKANEIGPLTGLGEHADASTPADDGGRPTSDTAAHHRPATGVHRLVNARPFPRHGQAEGPAGKPGGRPAGFPLGKPATVCPLGGATAVALGRSA
jgi:hypothetical protein